MFISKHFEFVMFLYLSSLQSLVWFVLCMCVWFISFVNKLLFNEPVLLTELNIYRDAVSVALKMDINFITDQEARILVKFNARKSVPKYPFLVMVSLTISSGMIILQIILQWLVERIWSLYADLVSTRITSEKGYLFDILFCLIVHAIFSWILFL